MLVNILILAFGLIALVKSADLLVDGSSSIARRLGISTLVIGLTIVAFGTSAPELVVNVISAFRGSTDIALGNVNGSNIANILLILGLTAIIAPIKAKNRIISREIPFMILSSAMLFILLSDKYIVGEAQLGLDRIDALALLGFFSVFLVYMFQTANDLDLIKGDTVKEKTSTLLAVLMSLGGFIGLVIGGSLTVNSSIKIASTLGLSEGLIAATIIAVGTSLPELATSLSAARKGQTDIAIGNVVGSNIFNVFFVLGTTGLISTKPLISSQSSYIDAGIGLISALLIFILLQIKLPGSPRKGITRIDGFILLLMYISYIVFLIIRG